MNTRTLCGRTRVRPILFRHPIRDILPAAVQGLIQDGVLEGAFRESLRPSFLFPRGADLEPMNGDLGQRVTMQRTGLLTPVTTPLTGSDPSAATYNVEFFEAVLDQYGNSMDTNMLASATTAARKYTRDVVNLGINAGQSLNRIARARMFGAYAGGRTWTRTTDGASNTSLAVHSVDGFGVVLVNGKPTAVSATNPLNITINGVANTVTGVNTGTRTLTLGTATTDTLGQVVVAENAPVTIRPNARTSGYTLVGGDVATMGLFLDAAARLRTMNVPPAEDGLYLAHCDPTTIRQLLDDTSFKNAFQGQNGTTEIRQGTVTDFGGVRFIPNNEAPTDTGDGATVTTIRRPIVVGAGALIATPMQGQADLLAGTGVQDSPSIEMIDVDAGIQVALIVRPPQDRLQQVVSTSWAWVGDFAVPTDATANGDAALVKRAVVIEHA